MTHTLLDGHDGPLFPVVDVEAWPVDALPALLALCGGISVRVAARLGARRQSGVVDASASYSASQVAARLSIPLSRARKLIARRELPTVGVGRYARVLEADVAAYCAANRRPARPTRALASRVHGPYTPGHDKPSAQTTPKVLTTHAGRVRPRARRAADDARALGTGSLPDSAARGRPLQARRRRAGPLDLGPYRTSPVGGDEG